MMRLAPRYLLTLAAIALLVSTAPTARAETVFVFDAAGTATAFDATRFERIGSRPVGVVGRSAHEVASEEGRRFFIVGAQEVVVLDESLQVLRRLPLDGVSPGDAASALDPETGLLAVAAGHVVYLIDTSEMATTGRADAGADIVGLTLAPEGGAVNVLLAGAGTLRTLDLETAVWMPGTFEIPDAAPTLAGGGFAGVGRNIYDLSRLPRGFFGRSRVPSASADSEQGLDSMEPLAADAGGAVLSPVGGFARLFTSGGAQPLVSDEAGAPVPLTSIAGSGFLSDGGLVVANRDAKTLVRLDAAGRGLGDITLASAPASLAIAPNPVEQSTTLTKLSGDNQFVAEGAGFFITVGHPTGGLQAFLSSNPDVIDCNPSGDPDVIDLATSSPMTSIACTAQSVTVTTAAELTVSVPSLSASVVFNITVFNAGGPDGLTIVSGDGQSVAEGDDVSLVVELRLSGAPASGKTLNVNEVPNSALDCPATVQTAATGLATITCTAEDVTAVTPAAVEVTYESYEVEFSVTVQPDTGAGGLTKVTNDPINIVESLTFQLTVEAKQAGGSPQSGLNLNITENNSFVNCPNNAVTGAQGRATVTCTASNVSQNRTTLVTFSDGTRSVVFTVNVLETSNAGGIQIVSGNNQTAPLGAQLQPLVVSVFQNGSPRTNLRLVVTVEQDQVYLFCGSPVFTNASGIASIDCFTSNNATTIRNVTVNVTDPGTGIDLNEPFNVTILPTQGEPAADLALQSDSSIQGRVGQRLEDAIEVKAVDAMGAAAAGALVFFRSNDDGVEFDPSVATTNSSGIARTDVVFGCPNPTGTIQIGVTPETTNATVSYGVGVGSLAALTITQGNNQSGTSGATLATALGVRSEDQCGNTLPRQPVSWSVSPPNAATLLNTGTQTNNAGIASTRVQLGSFGGAFTVTATSGAVTAVFNLTVNSMPTNLSAVSGGSQNVPAGAQAAAPVVVRVTNAQGQPVNGVEVRFNVIAGSATLQPATATTSGDGLASAVVTAGQTLGEIIIEASAINRTARFSLFIVGRTPEISAQGVVNGASFRVGLTPGGTGTIFGSRMMEGVNGVAAAPFNGGFPLLFRGVRVTINGQSAPILALADVNGQQQINIQVPFGLAAGPASVVVNNNGSSTTIAGVQILAQQPGIFEVTVGNQRFAAALHADYSLVEPSNPARPNEVILLFLTGLGVINPAVPTNVPGPSAPLSRPTGEVVVGINNAGVQNLGAFYAPGLVTVFQINFRTGASLPNGTVNLSVVYNGVGSQTVLLPTASQ